MTTSATKQPAAPDVDELERIAAEATTRAAEAAAQARAIRAAAAEQRQQRIEDYDRQVMASYRRADGDDAVAEARKALHSAILADPVWSAWLQLLVAQHKRLADLTEASGASARLGRGPFPNDTQTTIDQPDFDLLARFVADQAGASAAKYTADRAAVRQAAGDATTKEKP